MRLREQYKHLLNYGANLITLLVEGVCFGYIWYSVYEEQFGFWRRGNWAVVGLYVLVIFFFTKVFGGYNIGYMRMTDIALSHILSILLSGIVGYLELCLICRDSVSYTHLDVYKRQRLRRVRHDLLRRCSEMFCGWRDFAFCLL